MMWVVDIGGERFSFRSKKQESKGFPEKSVSIDQIAAEHVGSVSRFLPSLRGSGGRICVGHEPGSVPPVNSPSRLFNALFTQAPLSERNIERERLLISSVLDALMGSAKSLQGSLMVLTGINWIST